MEVDIEAGGEGGEGGRVVEINGGVEKGGGERGRVNNLNSSKGLAIK